MYRFMGDRLAQGDRCTILRSLDSVRRTVVSREVVEQAGQTPPTHNARGQQESTLAKRGSLSLFLTHCMKRHLMTTVDRPS